MAQPDPVPVTLAVDAVVCSCSDDCNRTIVRGDKAFWVKGQGLLHADCHKPIELPPSLQVALRAVRTALPGIPDSHVAIQADPMRVDLKLTKGLHLVIWLEPDAPETTVHLALTEPPIRTPVEEGLPDATEGNVLTWVDEHLVPALFEHTHALRAKAIGIEQALGFNE